MKIFLGGTCNNSNWRNDLIPLLNCNYFNPVVENWTDECKLEEIKQRETCDIALYVLTPLTEGFYSIAELISDCCQKSEGRVIFCLLEEDGGKVWTDKQKDSWESIKKMVTDNNQLVIDSGIEGVARYINFRSKYSK